MIDAVRRKREKMEVAQRLQGKRSKENVSYRPSHERETKISCAECENYQFPGQAESTCAKVAGMVEGRDVCDIFTRRPASSIITPQSQGEPVSVTVSVQLGNGK